MDVMNRVSDTLKMSIALFEEHQVDSPVLTAEILMSDLLGIEKNQLFLKHDVILTRNQLDSFKCLVKRRLSGEPVAYITGKKGFWDFEVDVNRNVLIPRPDTECVVEEVIKELSVSGKTGKRILEIGTGSGIITIALARQFPAHSYIASDISPEALVCAKSNCVACCPDSSVSFFSGNLFEPVSQVSGVFDFIISNPPYIPTGEIISLQREIREFEPIQALDGDSDGLSFIRSIIYSASDHLAPGGSLFLETGFDQKEKTETLADKSGLFSRVESVNDYGGNHRVVKLTKKSCSL